MFTREVGGTSTGVKAWRRLSGLDGVDRRSVLFQVGRRLRSGDLRRRLRQQSLVPAAGAAGRAQRAAVTARSEEHTSELQSLMRISYAVFCLKKKKNKRHVTDEYV